MTAERVRPAGPPYTEPSEELIEEFTDAIGTLVWEFANDLVTPIEGLPEPGRVRTAEQVAMAGRPTNLARLRLLREVGPAAERIASLAAKNAGQHGATYPQLGQAWGITRQAARSRWPGVVNASDQRPPVSVELAGGTANIYWDPEDDGWCWSANAANGEHQTEGECASSEEAAAHAGAFLVANSL
ncbi:hypothetical protein [Actinoallomurus soli]|uniref:hypothetical protein n=1 Tax=Actinoallomurus soli TaxID=2952535 RepID=UPI0020928931|nr:hypothetical protein [Actinoallomurus soli]MCO5974808.1 hypothetical protein [Actinoallomurus soli]